MQNRKKGNTVPIRFGIIACSNIARRRFVPALINSPIAKLERIGSRSIDKAKQFALDFGCSKHGFYEDVLDDPDVDCVYISTPVNLHEYWVMEAARHGKHVICEKPAVMNYQAALGIIECCRQNQVKFLEGYMFQYHPQYTYSLEVLKNNIIGVPRLFTSQFTYPRPPQGDIRLNPDLGGGVFFDSAGYPVAAVLMLIDDAPDLVLCTVEKDRETGVDKSVAITITFKSGITAQIFTGFDIFYRSYYSIHGTLGRLESERAFAVPTTWRVKVKLEAESGTTWREFEPVDHFQLMIEAFCKKLIDDKELNINSDRNFLRQHAIMDAALRSWSKKDVQRVVSYPG